MSLEVLGTGAAVGTFIVIAATAIAAVVQLRHLRAQNELTGLLTVLARVEDANFNAWVDGARDLLKTRLPDREYRLAIQRGDFDRKENPWLNLGNSYDWVGSLVKNKLIPANIFMDTYAYRVIRAWDLMQDVTAVLRRERGRKGIWENFEYLAVLAREFAEKHPDGNYPKGVARTTVTDRWLVEDAA